MPKLLDSMALALALSACAPAVQKPAISGREPLMEAQTRHPALSATAPSAANKPAPLPADGYSCNAVQNSVKNEVTRCCLAINPYKSCHDINSGDLGSFSHDNTVTVGNRVIPNYVHFKDGIPPAVYLKYLAESSGSATDLASALTTFITYRDVKGDDLLGPEEIIAQGAGDCDNTANLFVELLEMLGKKTGHDYKAMVLGLDGANHAVAVFMDTDGKWKALDMALPFNEIGQKEGKPDFFSASSIFEKNRAVGPLFYERHKLGWAAGAGARIDRFLDTTTMMPGDKEIAVTLELDYNPNVNPDTFLAGYDWRRVELAHLHLNDGVTAYYRKGVLTQLSESSKITFYDSGRVTQIQYQNHPTIRIENFTADGSPESRELKDGTTEVFSAGVLFQRIYEKGPVQYIVYYPSGIVRQKNYRAGGVEWFDEAGRMINKAGTLRH